MRNSILPVMGVLTVIAGAVGLQLGESAIAQIDPLYFEGAAPSVRDVSQQEQPEPMPGFAEASGWSEGYEARLEECGDCGIATAAEAPALRQPPLADYADATIAPRWEQAVTPLTEDDLRIDRSLHAAEVERYLHYPVSADQAGIRAGLDGGAPAEALDAPLGL